MDNQQTQVPDQEKWEEVVEAKYQRFVSGANDSATMRQLKDRWEDATEEERNQFLDWIE